MQRLNLILGDQLFPDISALPTEAPIFMREDFGLCTRFLHHQQKIVLFLSAMRHRRDELRADGWEVIYQELDPADQRTFGEALAELGAEEIHLFEPSDPAFEETWPDPERLVTHRTPAFLICDAEWRSFRQRKPRGIMADFYRIQRLERRWLLEPDGGPAGGQWSFDAENRKPMPKGRSGPPIPWIEPDDRTRDAIRLVSEAFPSHPGRAEEFRWPVDRAGALAWLDDFILQRLPDFGAYEDSMSANADTLWHSLLSPLVNLGLILPGEAVEAAIRAYKGGWAPLNSVEGFVRQVGGWREFVRRIDIEYRASGFEFRGQGEGRRLAACWREGGTGLPPLDAVIGRCQRLGWAHHIERLMVAGSLLMMVEADIDEAYRWFMEMFIDSAEWVMRPNVYGMSLFADGGLLATKPYISGSAYILKMSDYPKGSWCDAWDGLYWRFVHRQRRLFEENPRSRMALGTLERMDPGRRDRIFAAAEEFIGRTTLPPGPSPAAR